MASNKKQLVFVPVGEDELMQSHRAEVEFKPATPPEEAAQLRRQYKFGELPELTEDQFRSIFELEFEESKNRGRKAAETVTSAAGTILNPLTAAPLLWGIIRSAGKGLVSAFGSPSDLTELKSRGLLPPEERQALKQVQESARAQAQADVEDAWRQVRAWYESLIGMPWARWQFFKELEMPVPARFGEAVTGGLAGEALQSAFKYLTTEKGLGPEEARERIYRAWRNLFELRAQMARELMPSTTPPRPGLPAPDPEASTGLSLLLDPLNYLPLGAGGKIGARLVSQALEKAKQATGVGRAAEGARAVEAQQRLQQMAEAAKAAERLGQVTLGDLRPSPPPEAEWAAKFGAGLAKVGQAAEAVPEAIQSAAETVTETLLGANAAKLVTEGLDFATSARGTGTAALFVTSGILPTEALSVVAPVAALKGVGESAKRTGEVLHAVAATPADIHGKLSALARDARTPAWLRSLADDRWVLGLATLGQNAWDFGKVAGAGALTGAGFGALFTVGATDPEFAKEQIQLGGVFGLAGALPSAVKAPTTMHRARIWQRTVGAARELLNHHLSLGLTPETLAQVPEEAWLAAAAAMSASGRDAAGKPNVSMAFVDDATYTRLLGKDQAAMSAAVTMEPSRLEGAPAAGRLILVNVDAAKGNSRALLTSLWHEIGHATASVMGRDPKIYRTILDALHQARGQEADFRSTARALKEAYVRDVLEPLRRGQQIAPDSYDFQRLVEQEIARRDAESVRMTGDPDAWVAEEALAEAFAGVFQGNLPAFLRLTDPTARVRVLGRLWDAVREAAGVSEYVPRQLDTVVAAFRDFYNAPELVRAAQTVARALQTALREAQTVEAPAYVIRDSDWGVREDAPVYDLGDGRKGNDYVIQQTPGGPFVRRSPKEIKKIEKSRQLEVRRLFPVEADPVPYDSPQPEVRPRRGLSGDVYVGGRQIAAQLARATTFSQWHKDLGKVLDDAIANGRALRGHIQTVGTSKELGGWAASVRRSLGNIMSTYREFIPFYYRLSKEGNVLVDVLDITAMGAKALDWAQREGTPLSLELWGGNVEAFRRDVITYLRNHAEGRPGETNIGPAKRDIINAFLLGRNAAFEPANPYRAQLTGRDAQGVLRSYRLDRIATLYTLDSPLAAPNYRSWVLNASPERRLEASEKVTPLLKALRQGEVVVFRTGEGLEYKFRFDGYQDFTVIGQGYQPQFTALENVPGVVTKNSTTYGLTLVRRGLTPVRAGETPIILMSPLREGEDGLSALFSTHIVNVKLSDAEGFGVRVYGEGWAPTAGAKKKAQLQEQSNTFYNRILGHLAEPGNVFLHQLYVDEPTPIRGGAERADARYVVDLFPERRVEWDDKWDAPRQAQAVKQLLQENAHLFVHPQLGLYKIQAGEGKYELGIGWFVDRPDLANIAAVSLGARAVWDAQTDTIRPVWGASDTYVAGRPDATSASNRIALVLRNYATLEAVRVHAAFTKTRGYVKWSWEELNSVISSLLAGRSLWDIRPKNRLSLSLSSVIEAAQHLLYELYLTGDIARAQRVHEHLRPYLPGLENPYPKAAEAALFAQETAAVHTTAVAVDVVMRVVSRVSDLSALIPLHKPAHLLDPYLRAFAVGWFRHTYTTLSHLQPELRSRWEAATAAKTPEVKMLSDTLTRLTAVLQQLSLAWDTYFSAESRQKPLSVEEAVATLAAEIVLFGLQRDVPAVYETQAKQSWQLIRPPQTHVRIGAQPQQPPPPAVAQLARSRWPSMQKEAERIQARYDKVLDALTKSFTALTRGRLQELLTKEPVELEWYRAEMQKVKEQEQEIWPQLHGKPDWVYKFLRLFYAVTSRQQTPNRQVISGIVPELVEYYLHSLEKNDWMVGDWPTRSVVSGKQYGLGAEESLQALLAAREMFFRYKESQARKVDPNTSYKRSDKDFIEWLETGWALKEVKKDGVVIDYVEDRSQRAAYAVLGDKFGPYWLTMIGHLEEVVIDLWMMRLMGVVLGSPFEWRALIPPKDILKFLDNYFAAAKTNDVAKIEPLREKLEEFIHLWDSPENEAQRNIMRQAIAHTAEALVQEAERLGLTPDQITYSSVQAVLWYEIKRLLYEVGASPDAVMGGHYTLGWQTYRQYPAEAQRHLLVRNLLQAPLTQPRLAALIRQSRKALEQIANERAKVSKVVTDSGQGSRRPTFLVTSMEALPIDLLRHLHESTDVKGYIQFLIKEGGAHRAYQWLMERPGPLGQLFHPSSAGFGKQSVTVSEQNARRLQFEWTQFLFDWVAASMHNSLTRNIIYALATQPNAPFTFHELVDVVERRLNEWAKNPTTPVTKLFDDIHDKLEQTVLWRVNEPPPAAVITYWREVRKQYTPALYVFFADALFRAGVYRAPAPLALVRGVRASDAHPYPFMPGSAEHDMYRSAWELYHRIAKPQVLEVAAPFSTATTFESAGSFLTWEMGAYSPLLVVLRAPKGMPLVAQPAYLNALPHTHLLLSSRHNILNHLHAPPGLTTLKVYSTASASKPVKTALEILQEPDPLMNDELFLKTLQAMNSALYWDEREILLPPGTWLLPHAVFITRMPSSLHHNAYNGLRSAMVMVVDLSLSPQALARYAPEYKSPEELNPVFKRVTSPQAQPRILAR